ncbi:MAG: FAD/NAD(P)-binding protein, partial [Armatimonadetes bacterium]|nr:FAD/NAD(P)-binding protein [Akkermansiaceae bacterium]
MNHRETLAIIGSGASSIYLLKHLLDESGLLKDHLREISIFEKSRLPGMGMPYSPQTTDRFNMSNISSDELPELPVSFAAWLRTLDPAVLEELNVPDGEISTTEIYSRLALGRYLNVQYKTIISRLEECGIHVHEY